MLNFPFATQLFRASAAPPDPGGERGLLAGANARAEVKQLECHGPATGFSRFFCEGEPEDAVLPSRSVVKPDAQLVGSTMLGQRAADPSEPANVAENGSSIHRSGAEKEATPPIDLSGNRDQMPFGRHDVAVNEHTKTRPRIPMQQALSQQEQVLGLRVPESGGSPARNVHAAFDITQVDAPKLEVQVVDGQITVPPGETKSAGVTVATEPAIFAQEKSAERRLDPMPPAGSSSLLASSAMLESAPAVGSQAPGQVFSVETSKPAAAQDAQPSDDERVWQITPLPEMCSELEARGAERTGAVEQGDRPRVPVLGGPETQQHMVLPPAVSTVSRGPDEAPKRADLPAGVQDERAARPTLAKSHDTAPQSVAPLRQSKERYDVSQNSAPLSQFTQAHTGLPNPEPQQQPKEGLAAFQTIVPTQQTTDGQAVLHSTGALRALSERAPVPQGMIVGVPQENMPHGGDAEPSVATGLQETPFKPLGGHAGGPIHAAPFGGTRAPSHQRAAVQSGMVSETAVLLQNAHRNGDTESLRAAIALDNRKGGIPPQTSAPTSGAHLPQPLASPPQPAPTQKLNSQGLRIATGLNDDQRGVETVELRETIRFATGYGPVDNPAMSRTMASGPTMPPDLPQNVAKQMAAAMRAGGESSAELHLSPSELGRVRISLSSSEAGMVVTILAERPETLDLMRRHADQLAREFYEIGYEAAEFSFGQNMPDQAGKDNGAADHEKPDLGDEPRIDPLAEHGQHESAQIRLDRVDLRL